MDYFKQWTPRFRDDLDAFVKAGVFAGKVRGGRGAQKEAPTHFVAILIIVVADLTCGSKLFFSSGAFLSVLRLCVQDQSIMSVTVIKNPKLVHLVHARVAGPGLDEWFYLQEYLGGFAE